ncbi:MAG: anthranilate phosphoribosyltransferase [Nitrospirota bacterium]
MTSPTDLAALSPDDRMVSYLKRIATGPQMSKNLSREEARDGMNLVLRRAVDPVRSGVFLVALRMKRETDEENLGVLAALRDTTHAATVDVPDLVDLGDPYDGFSRHLPAPPFLPAVLAACGVPTVSHGCETLGPKYGVTHHQILKAAGLRVDLTPEEAAARIADPNIGWAYVDQAQFHPELDALSELRRLIIKRPCISTWEKLCGPVRARGRNHLIVGYVHPGYERSITMAGRDVGYASTLVVRGIEGGVIPSLNAQTRVVSYQSGKPDEEWKLNPKDAGIESTVRSVPITSKSSQGSEDEVFDETSQEHDLSRLAEPTAEAGINALKGTTGPMRDSLVLAAAMILRQAGQTETLTDGADRARRAIDAGGAHQRFFASSDK